MKKDHSAVIAQDIRKGLTSEDIRDEIIRKVGMIAAARTEEMQARYDAALDREGKEDSPEGPVPKKPLVNGCDLCEDNHAPGPLHLHARCHMTAPLQASIEGHILTLRCYLPECRRVVTRMRIAEIL